MDGLLKRVEVKLVITMMGDVANFDTVMNKYPKLNFKDETASKMLDIMKSLYVKLGVEKIDKSTLEDYTLRQKLSDADREECLRTFTIINNTFTSGVIEINNFDAIFEEYSMVSTTNSFFEWGLSCGGVEGIAEKLLKLNSMEEINQVIEGRMLDFFSVGTASASIIDTNLSDLIDETFINNILTQDNTIETVPLLSQFYVLNRITKGFVRGLTGVGARSGVGKSSFMLSVFVMSMLENSNSKICLYCNEQTANVMMISLFFGFLSQVFNMRQREGEKYHKLGQVQLSRDKYISGTLTEEDLKRFVLIIKLFKKEYKNRIIHSYFEDMTPTNLANDIRKKYKSGVKFFFYDTFKSTEEDYKQIMNLATVFDQVTKKFPIHGYLSLQLSDESAGVSYLDNRYLASAKGIKRLLECLLLMRKLDTDELKYLKVHKLGREDQTVPINLEGKNYYAVFIDKNRNGSEGVVLLYEIYLDLLKYKEIGVIGNMPKDSLNIRPQKSKK